MVPEGLIGLLMSNSAENEWCARTGSATAVTRARANRNRTLAPSHPRTFAPSDPRTLAPSHPRTLVAISFLRYPLSWHAQRPELPSDAPDPDCPRGTPPRAAPLAAAATAFQWSRDACTRWDQ